MLIEEIQQVAMKREESFSPSLFTFRSHFAAIRHHYYYDFMTAKILAVACTRALQGSDLQNRYYRRMAAGLLIHSDRFALIDRRSVFPSVFPSIQQVCASCFGCTPTISSDDPTRNVDTCVSSAGVCFPCIRISSCPSNVSLVVATQ